MRGGFLDVAEAHCGCQSAKEKQLIMIGWKAASGNHAGVKER